MKQPLKLLRRKAATAEPDILWLNDYLPYRFGVAATRMLREAARVYKQHSDPLTTPEWRVMCILSNFEPLVASEISRISMLDKVAVSRALSQLGARGLVARDRNRQDRRVLEVTLTRDGWRLYEALAPLMRQQEQLLRSIIDPEDVARVFAILDRFDAFFADLTAQRGRYGEVDVESVLRNTRKVRRP